MGLSRQDPALVVKKEDEGLEQSRGLTVPPAVLASPVASSPEASTILREDFGVTGPLGAPAPLWTSRGHLGATLEPSWVLLGKLWATKADRKDGTGHRGAGTGHRGALWVGPGLVFAPSLMENIPSWLRQNTSSLN